MRHVEIRRGHLSLLGMGAKNRDAPSWMLAGGIGWLYGLGICVGPFFGVGVGITVPGGILAGAGGGVGIVAGVGLGTGAVWGSGRGFVNGFGLPVPMSPPDVPTLPELRQYAEQQLQTFREQRAHLRERARTAVMRRRQDAPKPLAGARRRTAPGRPPAASKSHGAASKR